MRVLLIHPDDPFQALDVVPLVRLLRDASHEVMSVGPASATRIALPIDPSLVFVERDQGAALRVNAFAPQAYAAIGAPVPAALRGALKHSKDLLAHADGQAPQPESVRAGCDRVAAALLPSGAREALEGARQSWSAAVTDALRATVAPAREQSASTADSLREACLSAADQIAHGLERSREMEGVARLIQTLREAMIHHAQDAADLQTQLEARAATIQERDDLVASLRAEIAAIGLQLDRMHRLGAELQESHRVAASLRDRLAAAESAGGVAEVRAQLKLSEESVADHGRRLAEVGRELERVHRVAGELRAQLETRTAEVTSLRAQLDAAREQVREIHTLGAELRRMHDVATELKAQVEVRSARLIDAERDTDQLRADLQEARRSAAGIEQRAAQAAADASRAREMAAELVQTRTELVQAIARVESIRSEIARVRSERDTLDEVVSARDAELADAQALLNAERRRNEAMRAQVQAQRLRIAALTRQNQTLGVRLGELLASRWRKLGQRLGLAMVMPWERQGHVPSPSPTGAPDQPRAVSPPNTHGAAGAATKAPANQA
jgi:hypothetical protein